MLRAGGAGIGASGDPVGVLGASEYLGLFNLIRSSWSLLLD